MDVNDLTVLLHTNYRQRKQTFANGIYHMVHHLKNGRLKVLQFKCKCFGLQMRTGELLFPIEP